MANQNGTLTVERSLISGNSALFGGGDSGAIQNFGTPASPGPPAMPDLPGHLVVSDSTVTGNSARLVGGIYSWNDNTNTLVVTNSTIAGNATTDGPALPARDGAGGLIFPPWLRHSETYCPHRAPLRVSGAIHRYPLR